MNVCKLTIALGLTTCLVTPAFAGLQFAASVDGIAVIACADNQPSGGLCPGDINPSVGTLSLASGTFGGVQLNGSVQSSVGTPANPNPLNILNSSSLNIINTTGATVHIQAAAGDTSFTAPVDQATASASGTVQQGVGSSFTYTFFNDAVNSQGADNATDAPGAPIDTFSFTAALLADAFSHASGALSISDLAPFSMTQTFDAMLVAGGQLVGNSQTEIKSNSVSEPGTLAMLGTGLIGLWFANRVYRRRDDNVGRIGSALHG
jgi:hypothetical protein